MTSGFAEFFDGAEVKRTFSGGMVEGGILSWETGDKAISSD